ncbi:MAG TPA: hypothetical protein VEF76_05645, partial [Patescibacteria group bacterium]|nr:hypothetical protein [Patescibacteria group bacterium]
PELSQQAVTQLQAIWTGFMAGSPGFGAPREAGNIDGLDCRETFLQWRDACRAEFFSPLLCVEIVCLGMMDGDSRYRMMSGTAAAQAVHCLDIYCRQRGW